MRESGKLAEREEGFAPVQSPSLLTHLTIQLFNQAEGRIAAVAAEVTRLKLKGPNARKKIAQGKASPRATPWVNRPTKSPSSEWANLFCLEIRPRPQTKFSKYQLTLINPKG